MSSLRNHKQFASSFKGGSALGYNRGVNTNIFQLNLVSYIIPYIDYQTSTHVLVGY